MWKPSLKLLFPWPRVAWPAPSPFGFWYFHNRDFSPVWVFPRRSSSPWSLKKTPLIASQVYGLCGAVGHNGSVNNLFESDGFLHPTLYGDVLFSVADLVLRFFPFAGVDVELRCNVHLDGRLALSPFRRSLPFHPG